MHKRMFFAICLLAAALAAFGNDLQWPSEAYAIWGLRKDFPPQTAVVSWSDWLVFFNANNREPGVRMVLNEMAASGIRTVWWRTFGGGHALYASQVDGVTTGNYAGQGADYSTFNSLAEAVSYAHKLGIKVYAWYTPLEEAHGWSKNVRSVYTDAHPELTDYDYAGNATSTPSMYYPVYRAYKLALGKEMLETGVDGMVIDFERKGAPGRTDNWGYVPALVDEFNKKYARTGKPSQKDPDFIKFRASFVGQFMRELAAATHERGKKFIIMYQYPSKGVCAHHDVPAWCKEGFVDQLSVTNGWPFDSVTPAVLKDVADTFGQKPWPIQYAFFGTNQERLAQGRLLASAGTPDIVWFETTYMHSDNKYAVPRELACEDECALTSPEYDFAKGGTLHVSGAVNWERSLNGKVLAKGQPGKGYLVTVPAGSGKGALVLKGRVPANSTAAGIGLWGEAVGADGKSTTVLSGRDWQVDKGTLATVGVMGVPPFLAPFDKEVR